MQWALMMTSDYLVIADNLPEPCILLADCGYDSDNIQKTMKARNLVDRCFNKLKNARHVAIRYDKTAESFLGFTSMRIWLRHLPT